METLKDLRRAARLTQRDAAAAMDVSQCSISAWEVGTARPTLDKLRPLADLYGCTLEAIVDAIIGKGRGDDHVSRIQLPGAKDEGGNCPVAD